MAANERSDIATNISGWSTEEVRKIQYERDRVMGTVLKFLEFHLLWPKREDERDITRLCRRKSTIFYSVSFMMGFFAYYHAYYAAVVKRDYTIFAEDLATTGTALCLYMLFFTYIFHMRNQVNSSYKWFEYTLEFETPPDIYVTFGSYSKWFNRVYIIVVLVTLNLMPLAFFLNRNCEKEDAYEICGITPNIRSIIIPIDWTPLREMCLGAMIIETLIVLSTMYSLVGLWIFLVMNLILRMSHLRSQILSDHSKFTEKELEAKLRSYCRYYNSLVVAKDSFNCTTIAMHVIIFAISSVNLAILEFQTLFARSVTTAAFFMEWLIVLVAGHLIGQALINKNDAVCDAIYSLPWYEFPVKMKVYVLMMLARTQRPFEIKNGPISSFSAVNLLTILKTSYTYMTYLLNFMD